MALDANVLSETRVKITVKTRDGMASHGNNRSPKLVFH